MNKTLAISGFRPAENMTEQGEIHHGAVRIKSADSGANAKDAKAGVAMGKAANAPEPSKAQQNHDHHEAPGANQDGEGLIVPPTGGEADPVAAFALPGAREQQHLDWLCAQIAANRFLPVPAREQVFVGDGDYRAIGAEYLGHFVRMAGLKPQEDVLDIGCGIGRMAVPLTQYLDPERAIYFGIDPVASGIDWCRKTITPVYPNFRFDTQDIRNALYNPEGSIGGRSMRLPAKDGAFDFAAMVSVATHLPPEEIELYCAEIFRVLRPGGRLFLTAFVVRDPAELSNPKCDPRLRGFEKAEGQSCWHLAGENPMAAVGYDQGFFERVLKQSGFALANQSFGAWHGEAASHYQDIIIAQKPRRIA